VGCRCAGQGGRAFRRPASPRPGKSNCRSLAPDGLASVLLLLLSAFLKPLHLLLQFLLGGLLHGGCPLFGQSLPVGVLPFGEVAAVLPVLGPSSPYAANAASPRVCSRPNRSAIKRRLRDRTLIGTRDVSTRCRSS
jgi:hypothetical protein